MKKSDRDAGGHPATIAIESIKNNPRHFAFPRPSTPTLQQGALCGPVISRSWRLLRGPHPTATGRPRGTGAQGGYPDTAAVAKCTIVIAPLLQGRIPAICSQVTTVTNPGVYWTW